MPSWLCPGQPVPGLEEDRGHGHFRAVLSLRRPVWWGGCGAGVLTLPAGPKGVWAPGRGEGQPWGLPEGTLRGSSWPCSGPLCSGSGHWLPESAGLALLELREAQMASGSSCRWGIQPPADPARLSGVGDCLSRPSSWLRSALSVPAHSTGQAEVTCDQYPPGAPRPDAGGCERGVAGGVAGKQLPFSVPQGLHRHELLHGLPREVLHHSLLGSPGRTQKWGLGR